MGTSIAMSSEGFGVASDKSWLAARDGLDVMRSITVDPSLFAAEHIANGYIASGIVLAKKTSTGLYGPYTPAASNGLEVAAGHLFEEIKCTALTDPPVGAALFWRGIVRRDKLPSYSGTGDAKGELDADAQTDLPQIRYER